MSMGTLTAGKIDVGKIEINADSERILFGDATAPLTGTGIFMGKDSIDYEFRVGDPSGEHIHWDGSTLSVGGTITSETFSGTNATFTGGSFTFDGKLQVETFVDFMATSAPASVGGGCRVYANGATAELFVIDDAGNTTQLSPHDPETGEWWHNSTNADRRLVIRVERLLRDVIDRLGLERARYILEEAA